MSSGMNKDCASSLRPQWPQVKTVKCKLLYTNMAYADLALELGRCRLKSVNKWLGIRIRLVEKQQQMQLAVTTEDLLGWLLRKLHHQRQTVLWDELMKWLVRHGVVFQLRSPRVKLYTLTRWCIHKYRSRGMWINALVLINLNNSRDCHFYFCC